MATAAYKAWVKAGRPWHVANVVNDYRQQLHAAGWEFAELGTIGDEAHLQAETPQDHTPFSATGWPGAHPYPAVLALDVMKGQRPDATLDAIVRRWLSEARADRTPWVKYINWQGQRYDVRNAWAPRPTAGHFDHAHLSFSTDWADRSVGGWQVIPKGGNDMDTAEANMHKADTYRALATLTGTDAVYQLEGEPEQRREVNEPWRLLKRLESAVAELTERAPVSVDPAALAAALAGNQAFVSALAVALAAELGNVPDTTDMVLAFGRALVKGAEG
jgi:hypothetical protein